MKNVEYFLNAVLYSIWQFKMRFGGLIRKSAEKMITFNMNYLSTPKLRERMKENSKSYKADYERLFNDKNGGFMINRAMDMLEMFCNSYYAIVPASLTGVYMHFKNFYDITNLFVAVAISIVSFIPYRRLLNKILLKNDNYLVYFKQFDKESVQWKRKWRFFTFLFCFGGMLSFLFATVVLVLIATGDW